MNHTLLTKLKKRDELYISLNTARPGTCNYNIFVKGTELKTEVKEARKLKRESKAGYYNLVSHKSKNDKLKSWETIEDVMIKLKIK